MQKGLKPFIIRNIAILIGICYLLHPLHQQINHVLHTVSHNMSSPEAVLSHDHADDDRLETHESNDHMTAIVDHEHGFMNFMSELFESSGSDEYPGKTVKRDIKMSKHLIAQFEMVLPQNFLQEHKVVVPLHLELLKGYEYTFYPPPKIIERV